jgi:hypothetical protein
MFETNKRTKKDTILHNIQDFFGRYSLSVIAKINHNPNKTSVRTLNEYAFDVINGKYKSENVINGINIEIKIPLISKFFNTVFFI